MNFPHIYSYVNAGCVPAGDRIGVLQRAEPTPTVRLRYSRSRSHTAIIRKGFLWLLAARQQVGHTSDAAVVGRLILTFSSVLAFNSDNPTF